MARTWGGWFSCFRLSAKRTGCWRSSRSKSERIHAAARLGGRVPLDRRAPETPRVEPAESRTALCARCEGEASALRSGYATISRVNGPAGSKQLRTTCAAHGIQTRHPGFHLAPGGDVRAGSHWGIPTLVIVKLRSSYFEVRCEAPGCLATLRVGASVNH